MKIYFMKKSALDYIKANIGTLYKNYYQFGTSEWIDDLFDYDPYELFCETDDFELADTSLPPGEVDLRNCKILYSKLKDISDSQAADERLWAGLCNKTFYSYLRERWQYSRRYLKKTADDSSAILMRFFFKTAGRSGMFRNALARCWWTGRLTYSDRLNDKWELLDAIGPEDLISKISDIFYSNTYSSNTEITTGFCQGLKFFRDRGIRVANREHIRPTAQYLNAVGGGYLLDMYSSGEIKKMVVERISMLKNDPELAMQSADDEDPEDVLDAEADAESLDATAVNVDYEEFVESLEPRAEIDLNAVLGELHEVEYGCKVDIRVTPGDKYFTSVIPMAGESLYAMQESMLGKKIGFVWYYGDKKYEIVDIRR